MEGMPNPRFEFGDRIRKVRRDIAGMTQAEMASVLGVTQKAYAAWESGGKPGDIVAIARRVEQLWAGQVTAAWVMGVDEPAPPTPPPSHPHQAPVAKPIHRRLAAVVTGGEDRADDRELVDAKTDDGLDDTAHGWLRLVAEGSPDSVSPGPTETVGLGRTRSYPAVTALPDAEEWAA